MTAPGEAMAGRALSRRAVLRAGMGGAALAGLSGCVSTHRAHAPRPEVTDTDELAEAGSYDFNQRWLFGGRHTDPAATTPGYDDSDFAEVCLPHTVTTLSWRDWDPVAWEDAWIYRRHFDSPTVRGGRVFVDFDGVMTDAAVLLNGRTVAAHQGGYLPWSAELTGGLVPGENVLAVVVDARWRQVPPDGGPRGAKSVDYLQPAGIYRGVRMRVVPAAYLADVFARPADVLSSAPRVDVACTVDAATAQSVPLEVTVELLDGDRRIASVEATLPAVAAGGTTAQLSLVGLGQVQLWSPETPKLYTVQAILSGLPGGGRHYLQRRIGFREARFEVDGFYLNGQRRKIFGLNRHQLYPYVGMAMSSRLQRRDAEIIRTELNCNMVRCSHYPQDPSFLDACDELGLMVWQEAPGWHYVGGAAWQELAVGAVRDMVLRDRNRPSVIVWGTRLNETMDWPALYRRTRLAARELDGSRQTAGAMRTHSTAGWAEDVFAYDDYHHDTRGEATLLPPLPGVPYLVTEAVGTLDGPRYYRWTDPPAVLTAQALLHAEVHDAARADARYAGLLGWAGFDYASRNGHVWAAMKWPGVADTFRVPKPGAALYRSQVDPAVRPVLLPLFPWDASPGSPLAGDQALCPVATNCDLLEFYVDGQFAANATADRTRFGHLAYPPVVVDLASSPAMADVIGGPSLPGLRIDGYVRGHLAATVSMSADTTADRLALTAEDAAIVADGSDMTRVTFRAVDAYGNQRRGVTGEVDLSLTGPAVLVGDNPFAFGDYGGIGGAFVRSVPGQTGLASVTAMHAMLGSAAAQVRIVRPGPGRRFA